MGIYPDYGSRQDDIIGIWGDIHYSKCAALLIEELKRENQWWNAMAKTLKPGWWNVGKEETRDLRQHYGHAETIVRTLGKLKVEKALPEIQKMRTSWETVSFEPRGVFTECIEAIKNINGDK